MKKILFFFACRFWIYVLNLLQSLRVNSKTFSTRRMARSKISSTSWLEFARYNFFEILILTVNVRIKTNIFRLITTSCVRMKRNSPLLGFPWMRLDSNRSNRRSPDKKSERGQPVLFLLPHKNFYILCNCIKKINLLCNMKFFFEQPSFRNNQCGDCKLFQSIN